jgi:hypothetical protein
VKDAPRVEVRCHVVSPGEAPHTGNKNLFCYSSLLRSVSLRDTIFLPNSADLGRNLAAGRCGGVIARAIVL